MNCSNDTGEFHKLSSSPVAFASWSISIVGVVIYIYCLYFVTAVMKLNPFIKSIFVVMTTLYLFGYLAIFTSLIPILFFDIQNRTTCTLLTMPLTNSASVLQAMSALTSTLRYYMGWKTAKNKVYSDWVVIGAIGITVTFLVILTVLLYVGYVPLMLSKCINVSVTKTSFAPIAVFIFILVTTISGITADFGMMRLLDQLKKAQNETQLAPWKSTNADNENYDNAIPRNSTLISSMILVISAIWFYFCDQLDDTLLLNTLINLFLVPIVVKKTVSTNIKKNVIVPNSLQFHEEDDASTVASNPSLTSTVRDLNERNARESSMMPERILREALELEELH